MPFQLKKLTPTWIVDSMEEITPQALKTHGITAIITDLDNTLVPWRKYDISPRLIEWLADLKAHEITLCIASNTIHTKRLKQISETLGIPFVEGVRKPDPDGFVRSMKLMGSAPENTAVFGDQMFTDILAGRRLGLKTILLRKPLSDHELFWTKWVRNVERYVVAHLTDKGHWPADRKIAEPLEPAYHEELKSAFPIAASAGALLGATAIAAAIVMWRKRR